MPHLLDELLTELSAVEHFKYVINTKHMNNPIDSIRLNIHKVHKNAWVVEAVQSVPDVQLNMHGQNNQCSSFGLP